VFGTPVVAGVTLNGAYDAEKYPGPIAEPAFKAKNEGNTCDAVRSRSFSEATTLPIFGDTSPNAAAGFRPICVHVCPSECTSAHARIDRTIATFPNCAPNFGITPVGHNTPFTVSAFNEAGVEGPTLQSNVSTWLGAPVSKMKITFFAVFFVVTAVPFTSASNGCARYDPATPAPATSKNRRRDKCGADPNEACRREKFCSFIVVSPSS
jgi:hypothetical protein